MSGLFDINLIVFVIGILGVAFGLTALGLRRAERLVDIQRRRAELRRRHAATKHLSAFERKTEQLRKEMGHV